MTFIFLALIILPSVFGTILPGALDQKLEKVDDLKSKLKDCFADLPKDLCINITNEDFWKKAKEQDDKTGDGHLSFTELTAKYGYPTETHNVTTDDGYILTVYRIKGKNCTAQKKLPLVIMHGVLDTAKTWIISGPESGLGYLLADEGYDTWLPSFRGTIESLGHTKYSSTPDSKEYWDWSLDEYGTQDLKAVIDYVLKTTSKPKVHFVGHSVGTTSFFILCSEKPQYNDKIASATLLAPVAYAFKTHNLILYLSSFFASALRDFARELGTYELLCRKYSPIDQIAQALTEVFPLGTAIGLLLGAGGDPELIGLKNIKNIFGYYPDGISTTALVHFESLIKYDKFSKYDHGDPEKNIKAYGTADVPEYNLTAVTCPVSMVTAEGDINSIVSNDKKTASKLPNLEVFKILGFKIGHAHYVWAKNVRKYLLPIVTNMTNSHDNDC